MRKLRSSFVGVVAALAFSGQIEAAHNATGNEPDVAISDEAGLECADELVAADGEDGELEAFPQCRRTHGRACSQPGAMKMCEFMPGEPEVCICQDDNTWKCYWW